MPGIIESTCQLFAYDAKVFCKVSTNDDSMQLQDDLTRLNGQNCGNCHLTLVNVKVFTLAATITEQVTK